MPLAAPLEPAHNSVQRLIGEIVGCDALLVVKIANQPLTHFEIALALGVVAFVEPVEKSAESRLSRRPVAFHL